MKPILLVIMAYTILTPAYASSLIPEKDLPASVIVHIRSDYLDRAETMATDSTKDNSIIVIQNSQSFRFVTFGREFGVLPFTYLPQKPESWRKCMIRVLVMPGYHFLQDLETGADDTPCNGVMALSFKDVTSDGNGEIIAIFDATTSGNKSIEPDVAVYVYEPASQRFTLNGELSNKATSKSIKSMKDVLRNLSNKH